LTTFEELGIAPENIRALTELGFEYPMPIQEKVIPHILHNKSDVVALAQTGTGKTAAFGVPLIQLTNAEEKHPQALILSPTRELCIQIASDIKDFSKYNTSIRVLPVYGGSSIESQIKLLKEGVHIIVATPGRLIDLINRKVVKLNKVNIVVLDEADEMLNMGFQESINEILSKVPENRTTLLFSATMPKEVAIIARNYMKSPVEITAGEKNAGAENIKHIYYTVHARDKYAALKRIVDFYPDIYGIVFCRTRRETQEVADKLINDGYNAESLHGDLSQAQRDHVMQKFRIKHLKLLVATDVAARGIDVNNLTHIINYNLPDDLDAYIHRSGRTARAGKTGTSIAIINLREKHLIKAIEKKINKTFKAAQIPSGEEICEKQLFAMIDKMEKVEFDKSEIDPFLPSILRKLEWLEKEDIIKRFVALEFNRFIDYYRNSGDINVYDNKEKFKESRFHDDKKDRNSSQGFNNAVRLIINVGKEDGFYPKELLAMIKEYTTGKKITVGRIDLEKHSSFFEVENNDANIIVKSLRKANFKGIPIRVEITADKRQKYSNKKYKKSDEHKSYRSNNDNNNHKEYNRKRKR